MKGQVPETILALYVTRRILSMMNKLLVFIFPILSCLPVPAQQPAAAGQQPAEQHSPEINTTLMETTFLIGGPSARPGEEAQKRFGTCFIMFRRTAPDSNVWYYTLITAKHVLEDIRGENAEVTLRKRDINGDPQPYPLTLKIREGLRNLYTVHPTADVAAIDVSPPKDSIVALLGSDITNINWLATDEFLKNIEIHPGDELECLGYPLGIAANAAAYPVLGTGKIASYPILPQKKVGRILYRSQVQPGNSGGPAYFRYEGRAFKQKVSLGNAMIYQKIFGMVTDKADPVRDVDPGIGAIVPAIFIKETIDLLSGFESKLPES